MWGNSHVRFWSRSGGSDPLAYGDQKNTERPVAELPRYAAGEASGRTKVLNESAGRVGAIILLPITRRTGIGSQRSFCTTTTMLPSGLAKASWFS